MDRPIAPIFNITKRPRQALVSYPFDSQPTTLSTTNGPTPKHAVNWQSTQPVSWPKQGRADPSKMTDLLPPKPSLPQYQSQKTARTGLDPKATQIQGYSKTPTRTATVGGGSGQIRKTSTGQTIFQSSNMNHPMQADFKSNSQSQASSFQRLNGNKTSNFVQKRQYQQYGQGKPDRMTSHGSQTGPSTMSAVSGQASRTSSSLRSQQKFSTQAYNRSQLQGPSQISNIKSSSSLQPSTNSVTASTSKQMTYDNNKQDIDKSLRVLTGTVLSIRLWGNSPHSVPVMFEIHGTLNSTVTANTVTQGKEFLLRDETGNMPCVFFEIDRRIPLMTRGQWYRCMGSFDRKLGLFKCVSVRGSNLAERNLAKLMLPMSEQTLKMLVRDLRET